MDKLHRSLALVLIFAIILPILATGCGEKGSDPPDTKIKDSETAATKALVVSPDNPEITTPNKVTVTFGDTLLDEEIHVKVSYKKVGGDTDYGTMSEVYEIEAGDLKEFDDYVEIRLPYDATYFDQGADPALCMNTRSFNESTGEWDSIYSQLDTEKQEVIIYTNHFSKFGIFYVENEGQRMAKAWDYDYYSKYHELTDDEMVQTAQAITGNDEKTLVDLGCKIMENQLNYALAGNDAWGEFKNITDLATLGDSQFSTKFLADFDKAMSDLATYFFALKVVQTGISETSTDMDKQRLILDGTQLLISKWGAGHIGLGMALVAVWVLDKLNTMMFESGQEIKRSNIYAVYEYFNDTLRVNEGNHQWFARRTPQWRQVLIDIMETPKEDGTLKNEAEVQEELMAEIDRYCHIFWTDEGQEFWYDAASEAGYKRVPVPDESDREELTKQYKQELLNRFERSIVPAVNRYYRIKAEESYKEQLDQAMTFFNRVTKIKLTENIVDGKESEYAGYTWLLADLADGIKKEDWSGTISDSGEASIPVSLIGYIMAGQPAKIELYKPDQNIDTDAPAETLTFQFDYPEVVLKLNGSGPPFEDLIGEYTDGQVTIVDAYFTQQYIDSWEEKYGNKNTEDEENANYCDTRGHSPDEIMRAKGIPVKKAFRITPVEGYDNLGKFYLSPEDDVGVDCKYYPESGTLVAFILTNGWLTGYTFSVTYNEDRTRIMLEAEQKTKVEKDDDSYITYNYKGSKEVPAK